MNRAPDAPKSPKYSVFEARSGIEAGTEGVFQQAAGFSEVQHSPVPLPGALGTERGAFSPKYKH